MKSLLSLLGCLLCWTPLLHAQSFPYQIPQIRVSLSYFGELLVHPGIRLGVEMPISQSLTASSLGNRAWVVGGHLTTYQHRRNHRALIISGSISRERINQAGLMSDIRLESGYMASFVDGESFSWQNGEIVESGTGSSHFYAGVNGSLGWDFDKKSDLPLSVRIRPHLFIQAPFNSSLLLRAAGELQFTYHLP
ncbi:MAG: hypothetical protein AAF206_11665 [Bacteroidota bacterium]